MSAKAITWSVIIVVILVVIAFLTPFTIIGVGEEGIVLNLGRVSRVLTPGPHALTPFTESVVKMQVQTQKEQTDATAASADLQNVNASIAINYNVDPANVVNLYTNIGPNYKAVVIDPAIQEAVKAVTAKYTAEELITKRPAVTDDIQNALSAKLATDFIKVTSVSITDFKFSDSFNAAIEAKVTAAQNALAAQNKLQQVQFEAEQTIATAKAQAEAIQIQAEAINSAGGADYVQLQAIKQWNGVLPANLYGSAPIPFLSISK